MPDDSRHYSDIEAEQNAEESQQLHHELEPELEFLKDLRVHTINGRLALGNENLPFNVHKIFTEAEFVNEWLVPFALGGNSFGVNYFNFQAWGKGTNGGTLSALVVDEEHKPVLLVPPIITTNMNDREYQLLRVASLKINANMNDNMLKNSPHASMDVANKIREHLQAKSLKMYELIAPEFYARHGVDPLVEQQAFYIRDILNPAGSLSVKDMVTLREILYKVHRKERLTPTEEEFVKKASHGSIILGGESDDEDPHGDAEPSKPEAPFDPFSC